MRAYTIAYWPCEEKIFWSLIPSFLHEFKAWGRGVQFFFFFFFFFLVGSLCSWAFESSSLGKWASFFILDLISLHSLVLVSLITWNCHFFTHEGKFEKPEYSSFSFKISWVLQEVRGVSPTLEPCGCCWTSLKMLLWNFWACCHVLNLCVELFSLNFLCQKWVLFMLKHRFSLKIFLNRSFLAKVANKTSLGTFIKMKNLSRIRIESYSSMNYFY